MTQRWEWDPTLYAGSAPYYATGRLPYPPEVADVLRSELGLDGSGRLLDLGCGPGSLTLILAPLFDEAVGVDADAGMIEAAAHEAAQVECHNVRWVCTKAEDLRAGFGTFRVVTVAQSFHWMDGPCVATALHDLLTGDGAVVHLGATTHRGVSNAGDLPGPQPPRQEIDALVVSYLGPIARAGQSTLPHGGRSDEDVVLAGAGFVGPRRLAVGGGQVFARSEYQVVASVLSLSSAAPHLFGDRRAAFESDLRGLLRAASPSGRFWERSGQVTLSIWSAAGAD